jgi:hypothetical protein
MKLWFLLLTIILLPFISKSQFNYTYTDPCTGEVKVLSVPQNGITISYYGQVQTFTSSDFSSGAFDNWTNEVFQSYGNDNPCGVVTGMNFAINVIGQSSALTAIGILNSLDAFDGFQQNQLSNDATTADNASSGNSNNKSNSNSSGGTNTSGTGGTGTVTTSSGGTTTTGTGTTSGGTETTTTGGTTTGGTTTGGTTTSGTETTTTGGTTTGTGTEGGGTGTGGTGTEGGSGGSGGSGGGGAGQFGAMNNGFKSKETETKETETTGQTNVLGGTTATSQKISGNNPPTTILASDVSGFNYKTDETKFGAKISGGFTSVRWDGLRTHGFTADYMTAIKGPNGTLFFGNIAKRRVDILTLTGTVSFIGRTSIYGTISIGQLWKFPKYPKLKAIYLASGSFGNVFGKKFFGTTLITGGMYDFKMSKRYDLKVTGLFIYAPYINYYGDIFLKSPFVMMPLIGTNIALTKKFKLNINIGGSYAFKDKILNFTVTSGARFLI